MGWNGTIWNGMGGLGLPGSRVFPAGGTGGHDLGASESSKRTHGFAVCQGLMTGQLCTAELTGCRVYK